MIKLKSDREYIDEIYAKAKIRLNQQKKLKYKTVMVRITVIAVSVIFVVTSLSFTVFRSSILNALYKTSQPDEKVGSYTTFNLNEDLDQKELIKQSDIIIEGTITKVIGARWTNPNYIYGKDLTNSIMTYYNVKISTIYKGRLNGNKDLVISIHGGQIGQTNIKEMASPTIILNEQVVLFLTQNEIKPPLTFYPYKSFSILGVNQGIYIFNPILSVYENKASGVNLMIDTNNLPNEINSIK